MICPARDLVTLTSTNPFASQPSGSNITRFVSVLAKRLPKPPRLPLYLPSEQDWGVKIISIQGRFVVGLYIREMKAISYLGKIEKPWACPSPRATGIQSRRSRRFLALDSRAPVQLRLHSAFSSGSMIPKTLPAESSA